MRQMWVRVVGYSMAKHLLTQHGVYEMKEFPPKLLERREKRVFKAQRSVTGHFLCPVPGCLGRATTTWSLRQHFAFCHSLDAVNTPEKGQYPKCQACGMHTNPSVMDCGHERTQTCTLGAAWRCLAAVASALSLQKQLIADGDLL